MFHNPPRFGGSLGELGADDVQWFTDHVAHMQTYVEPAADPVLPRRLAHAFGCPRSRSVALALSAVAVLTVLTAAPAQAIQVTTSGHAAVTADDPPEARGTVAEWLAFARAAQAAGVQLRTLVPYPAARWPAALAGPLHPVAWDRRTTAAQVRRRVADAARGSAR